MVPLEKFLLMDLPYSFDGLYYGKGYATGMANIFGYTDNLEITVDVKTAKGTKLNVPMYGVGEIDQEDFIIFKDKGTDTTNLAIVPKFDFTGVDLDLNFDITPDAEIKIIFNEELGDVITARGWRSARNHDRIVSHASPLRVGQNRFLSPRPGRLARNKSTCM